MRLHFNSTLGPAIIFCLLLTFAANAQAAQSQSATAHDPNGLDTSTTDADSPPPPMTPEQIALINRYLTAVRAQPTAKIDTRSAAAGQGLTLQMTADATLANGTELPRGTKLTGRILRAQAYQKNGAAALLSIDIDRAVLKNGTTIPIRCVIRGVAPGVGVNAGSGMADASQPGSRPRRGGGGGSAVGGPVGGTIPLGDPTSMGGGMGSDAGDSSSPGTTNNPNSTRTSPTGSASNSNGIPVGDPGIGGTGSTRATPGNATAIATSADPEQPVASAGEDIHDTPHRTGLPGVMLSGASVAGASGTLSAFESDIMLDAGAQLTLGVITTK